jgi:hypothetical protein
MLMIFGIVQVLKREQSFSLLSSPRLFRYSYLRRIFLFVFFLLFSSSLPHLCLHLVLFTVTRSVVPTRFISQKFPTIQHRLYVSCISDVSHPYFGLQEACLHCGHASDLCGALCYPWIPRSEHVSVHLHCVWNI